MSAELAVLDPGGDILHHVDIGDEQQDKRHCEHLRPAAGSWCILDSGEPAGQVAHGDADADRSGHSQSAGAGNGRAGKAVAVRTERRITDCLGPECVRLFQSVPALHRLLDHFTPILACFCSTERTLHEIQRRKLVRTTASIIAGRTRQNRR